MLLWSLLCPSMDGDVLALEIRFVDSPCLARRSCSTEKRLNLEGDGLLLKGALKSLMHYEEFYM